MGPVAPTPRPESAAGTLTGRTRERFRDTTRKTPGD